MNLTMPNSLNAPHRPPEVRTLRPFALLAIICTASAAPPPAPPQATAVGYKLSTFSSTLARSSVDLTGKNAGGPEWYAFQFFHQQLPNPSDITFNPDGTVTLGKSGKISITTAAPSRTPSHWTGLAFGGGAYFEAILSFDPRAVVKANAKEWPAFWSMAIEHLADLDSQQWPGQTKGYMHFIEPDFFEYDVWSFRPPNYYGGAVHDWYGEFKKQCPNNFCNASNAGKGGTKFSNFGVATPENTDFTQFHKFGFLWVPATDSAEGYAQYYFDDKPTSDKVTWTKFSNQAPPPGNAPWTFGIIDRQHLAVILDTGAAQPMTVKSVNVWQASQKGNLTQ